MKTLIVILVLLWIIGKLSHETHEAERQFMNEQKTKYQIP